MKKFLHVGCGTRPKSQTTKDFRNAYWEVRFDINSTVNPDVVGSITDLHHFNPRPSMQFLAATM